MHPLTKIVIDGSVHSDAVNWVPAVTTEFQNRWKQQHAFDTELFEALQGSAAATVQVFEQDVWSAILQLKKPWVLDHTGVCAAALRMVPEVADPLSRLSSRLLSSDTEWSHVVVKGFVKAKERGNITVGKTRGLMPQTVLLNILNRLVMLHITPFIDIYSMEYGLSNVILGGNKGSQPQDVTFTIAQVLEKGRDRHNAAAVAQSDVEKCHDCIGWGSSLKALLSRRVPMAWARAALRIHRCPRIEFRVGCLSTPCLERSRSVLTGAPSSGLLARVCIEDSYFAVLPELESVGFKMDETTSICGMSWSDNLYTFASNAKDACWMMERWSFYLSSLCGLRLKKDSHEVVTASTRKYDDHSFQRAGVTWKKVFACTSLGQCITSTGEQSEDRWRIKRSWEAAFWRNARVLTCKKIPSASRLNFWGLISKGIGSFRYSMWTPSLAAGRTVEAWHNKIIARIIRVPKSDLETAEHYSKRRNKVVAVERDRAGLSVRYEWALSLVRWVEHLHRHPLIPAALLLTVQDDLWVQTVRALNMTAMNFDGFLAGATRTRVGAGRPIRWAETWLSALQSELGLDNRTRQKKLTKTRAEFVQRCVFNVS